MLLVKRCWLYVALRDLHDLLQDLRARCVVALTVLPDLCAGAPDALAEAFMADFIVFEVGF